jgi:uncharacterized protein YchJ
MEARNRVLAGECISRARVEAISVDPATSLEAIAQAIAVCDYEQAAAIALALARAGHPVPIAIVARILPGLELASITCALIAIATGDRAELIDAIEGRRFPQTKDVSELEAIVLFAAWRAGSPSARVIPQLRRLSARHMTAEGYALLAVIAQSLDDPNVAAATKPIANFAKDYAKQAAADERALSASVTDVLQALPAEVETSVAGGFTVRAAKAPGRNDPCPCNSGLKYKKCCADKPAVAPSPIPGLSWDDFLGSGAGRMTVEHVQELALRHLARVALSRLENPPLAVALRRFLVAHEWDHAERVVDEAARREGLGDELRDELVHALLESGELARARAHIGRLPEPLAQTFALDLAIADGPAPAWEALVRTARTAVASTDKIPDLELAYALLRAEPALGIVAARACIGTMHVDDAELMLDLVEEARDQLNAPPGDPAWDVYDALRERDDAQRPGGAADDAQLRATLQASSAQIAELERTLAAVRAELTDARTRPAAELVRRAEDGSESPARERGAALDARVRELEALIREGNEERRELRKQLQAAATPSEPVRRDSARGRRGAVEEADADVADEVPHGTRGIAVPRFERRAIDSFEAVPAQIAAEAMRTLGGLAAGDGFAWRGVKQAKDMTRQVLMARVGIHHRLLFRVEDGMLDVLDLITREQLMTTLKRLRGQR